MAGSNGFDPKHFQVSLRMAEKALPPAVHNAAEDTRVIVSGFICREQEHQDTERVTLHLAKVLRQVISAGSQEMGKTTLRTSR